jgi:hypothetical protein
LVADNGSLLRGPFVSTEGGRLPERESLRRIRKYGCNAVHCYAECAASGFPAGHCAAALDTLVKWTREDDLYLVITIGNCEAPVSAEFNAAFWTFYAGRYAGEPHVVYEIQNEPAPGPGMAPKILEMEKGAYAIIRAKAPDTPVLLFSYVAFKNGPKVVQDIQGLGDGVDWSKAVVAFHGYGETGRNGCLECLKYVLKAGYPCFQTEFYTWPWGKGVSSILSAGARYQDVSETGDFERLGVSWLTFLSVNQIFDDARFRSRIEQAGIAWKPDYGDWPAGSRSTFGNGGEPWCVTNFNDTLHIEAEDFDVGGAGVARGFVGRRASGGSYRPNCGVTLERARDSLGRYDVLATESHEWLEYTTYLNDPGLYSLRLRVSSPVSSNSVKVCLGGRDLTGLWQFPRTGGRSAWTTISNTVSLTPGQQVLRVEMLSAGWRLNWMELAPLNTSVLSNGVYRIIARHSGKALEVDEETVRNGAGLKQGALGGSNQLWVLSSTHRGANNYRIASRQTGKVLDALQYKRENGGKLQVWDGANTPNQRWLISPVGDGYYSLIAEHSGLALSVKDSSAKDGAPVCQWEYAGGTNQQWSLQAP